MVFVSCHGFLAVFFAYNLGTAHKVDPWSVIAKAGNDALYPEKFNVPLLNVSYPNMGYGGWKSMAGFHFHDIQGYKTTKTINDCLILCNAHPPCRAMNYVSPLSKCVLLGSGVDETMASKALWNNANANSVHIVFTSGSKSKVPTYQPRVPSSKLPFGMPAIAPNIYLTKRQRIVGGTEAVRYSYPFIVRVVSCPQATSCSVCGGTLLPPGADSKSTKVSSDLVLTAAHCVIIAFHTLYIYAFCPLFRRKI
uniref:Apple domain-containing protein n=1 Tax=Romanomermis culicivorax TaxID=13658 RepID=A0A915L1T8_ROMCU